MSVLKNDIFNDETFVFTPKGDVIALPQGSTIIDFAYSIHTQVGNRMIGAKINGMIAPIDKIPQNGEIVEIITSSASKGPSRDWLKIVKTSEARTKIRQWFKKEKRSDNIEVGRGEIERELSKLSRRLTEEQKLSIVTAIAKRIGIQDAEDLYNTIGYGGLPMSKIIPKLKDEYEKQVKPFEEEIRITDTDQVKTQSSKNKNSGGIIVDGQVGCAVKFARCCNPLPGDPVIGFITKGYGISIHKRDCPNVINGMTSPEFFNRWIHADWDTDALNEKNKKTFEAMVQIYAENTITLIADITMALADMKVAILQINTKKRTDSDIIINLTVGCKDTDHYNSIVSRLKSINHVTNIVRGFS